jgi:hypothetical protein
MKISDKWRVWLRKTGRALMYAGAVIYLLALYYK